MKSNNDMKKILCYGEVLWDVLPEGKRIGGAPLNVAYHLQKLGVESLLVSRIGDDDLGEKIKHFLEGNDLSTSLVQTDSEHVTSTVQATVGANHEVSYEIVENVAWDFIEYNENLKDIVEQADYLVLGSLSARSELTRKTLFKLLESSLKKVLDVNLRAPFYSKELLEKLLKKSEIVKMNEAELYLISDWFQYAGNDEERMKSLKATFKIDILIVTYGAKGAYVLSNEKDILHKEGTKVEVADTIGSGDAFLSGFLSQYIKGKSLQEALEVANEMGAFVATKDGGCPEYELSAVNL